MRVRGSITGSNRNSVSPIRIRSSGRSSCLRARPACRSDRCRWSSSCPRGNRAHRDRRPGRAGPTRSCRRSGSRLPPARPIVMPGPDRRTLPARSPPPRSARTSADGRARRHARRPDDRVPLRVGPSGPGGARSLQRAARNPQQEQVEDRQESELEQNLDRDRPSGRTSVDVEPQARRSRQRSRHPGKARACGHACRSRDPVGRVQVDQRTSPSPRCWSSQWRRETFGSSSTKSQPLAAPDHGRGLGRSRTSCRRA